jgi:hypothetical protein
MRNLSTLDLLLSGSNRDKRQKRKSAREILCNEIKLFISDTNSNYYLGLGGIGDVLLLLASCYDDPQAKVIFFANNPYFTNKFFELVKIPVFLKQNLMGNPFANVILDLVKSHANFKQSAHLADGLNYGDWINHNKYECRVKSYVPWIDKFGKIETKDPILIIAPSGSVKDNKRQRYLTPDEYAKLISIQSKLGYRIYCVGSLGDLEYYGLIAEVLWMTIDKIYSSSGSEDISFQKMLQIINTASKVISMDTWLKTYSLLCGIPTIVISSRWDGAYREYGSDASDFIFLNKCIWPALTTEKIENLLK